MCKMQVRVVVVADTELETPWATALGDEGERILMVRESTSPVQVCEGYADALRQCPIRMQLEVLRPAAVA